MKFKEGDRVVCIDNNGHEEILTLNKQYFVCYIDDDDFFNVIANNGEELSFFKKRFKLDKNYYRKQKIKQLRNGI
jgi:hypothetical protein